MSAKPIEQQLEELKPVPSARFYLRMARAPWATPVRERRWAYVAAGLTVLLAAALLIFSPQGQVMARELVSFFTRSGGDVVVVTPSLDTPTPQVGYVFDQEIAAVGRQAGFDVLEPAWLPLDPSGQALLSFDGASLEPEGNIVRIFYRYVLGGDGLTDGLVLREQQAPLSSDCTLCGMVGNSAVIESVQIGDMAGEYVQGVWKADDQGVWNWTADPYVQTLRFEKDGLAIELQFFGQEIGKAELIAIAASLK
jgi:hypothetical protein